jgi:hypothetical protein
MKNCKNIIPAKRALTPTFVVEGALDMIRLFLAKLSRPTTRMNSPATYNSGHTLTGESHS